MLRPLASLCALLLPAAAVAGTETTPITDPHYAANWGLRALDWERVYRAGFTGKGSVIAFRGLINCRYPGIRSNIWFNGGEDLDGNGRIDPGDRNGVDDDRNGCIDDFHGCRFDASGPPFYGSDPATGDEVCREGGHGHDTAAVGLAIQPVDGHLNVGVAPEAKLMVILADRAPLFRYGYPYLARHGVKVVFHPSLGAGVGGLGPRRRTCLGWRDVWTGGDPAALANFLDPRFPFYLWGEPDSFPACDPSQLAFGAVDRDGATLAENYRKHTRVPNPFIDLVLPGGDGQLNQGRARLSWAFGLLAGAIAVLQQAFPDADRTRLAAILTHTADPVGPYPYDANGWNGFYGHGRVNLYRAVSLGDFDRDGVPGDGDDSLRVGDRPCASGETLGCDDNCPEVPNPDQGDGDGDGAGDACDLTPAAAGAPVQP